MIIPVTRKADIVEGVEKSDKNVANKVGRV